MRSAIPHALVLTAGLGTRLRPLTHVRAKPAIPLAGEPLVRRIVRWLAASGVTELVLNLHYKPETIAASVGDGQDAGVHVRYSWEHPVLGSAGGPRLAAPIIGADTFLIVNGDTLTDLDLGPLVEAHQRADALVTMALVANEHPDRYGGVRLDDEGRVVGFAKRGAEAVGSCHFIGVQVAAARAFAQVAPGTFANSVGDVYDRLIAERPGSIRGHVVRARFWDIGTVDDYWRTSVAFAGGPGAEAGYGRGAGVTLAPDAVVRRSILWDCVQVGPGARVDECIVTDNVIVPAGACYSRSILVAGPDGIAATPFAPSLGGDFYG